MRKYTFYNEIGKTNRRGYKPRDKGEKSHAELKGPGEEKKGQNGRKRPKKKKKTNTQNNDDNNSSTGKPVCLRYCIVGRTPYGIKILPVTSVSFGSFFIPSKDLSFSSRFSQGSELMVEIVLAEDAEKSPF